MVQNFIENPDQAVFLSGLIKCNDPEWLPYRRQIYDKIISETGVYIVRFDFPKNRNCAFLHVSSVDECQKLLDKRFLRI